MRSWLRFFNPLYVRHLERKHELLERTQVRLATSAARLAQSSSLLAQRTTARQAAEAETIENALITVEGIRGTLQTVANDMSCGRISDAKILVDSLIMVLKGADR